MSKFFNEQISYKTYKNDFIVVYTKYGGNFIGSTEDYEIVYSIKSKCMDLLNWNKGVIVHDLINVNISIKALLNFNYKFLEDLQEELALNKHSEIGVLKNGLPSKIVMTLKKIFRVYENNIKLTFPENLENTIDLLYRSATLLSREHK